MPLCSCKRLIWNVLWPTQSSPSAKGDPCLFSPNPSSLLTLCVAVRVSECHSSSTLSVLCVQWNRGWSVPTAFVEIILQGCENNDHYSFILCSCLMLAGGAPVTTQRGGGPMREDIGAFVNGSCWIYWVTSAGELLTFYDLKTKEKQAFICKTDNMVCFSLLSCMQTR